MLRILPGLTGAFLGLGLGLAGCGYQPRGELDLPGSVRVRGGSFELRDALEAGLAGSGVRVAGEDAELVLRVQPRGFQERLLSVEPVRGGAREYQVAWQVRYTLRRRNAEQVLAPGEVRVVREYRVHPGERVSRTRERAVVHDEMRREAAATILRRLYALADG